MERDGVTGFVRSGGVCARSARVCAREIAGKGARLFAWLVSVWDTYWLGM